MSLCGYVAMWLRGFGYAAMWLYGYVAMWLCGDVAVLNFARIAHRVSAYSCPGLTCFSDFEQNPICVNCAANILRAQGGDIGRKACADG